MYIHDLSPFLWRISDTFGIQWNGLSYMVSFLLSFVFVGWMAFRQRSELTPRMLGDFITSCALGVLIGGRLGYCLFYAPDLFLKFRPEFPFWGVFALGEGGMSVHGSIVGLFIVGTLFAIRTGVSRLYLFDLMAVTAPLGLLIGRVANFITGEFIGRPTPNGFSFSVKFPSEIFSWPQTNLSKLQDLTPLAEKIGQVSKEQWTGWLEQWPTQMEAKESIHKVLIQIVQSLQSGNAEVKSALAPLLAERHAFQLYAAVGEGLLLFLFLFILWYRPRKPGVIAANFLVFYSAIRIFDDNFRMLDPGFGPEMFGMTRVQVLSVLMFIIGLVMLFIWGRRETLPARGWGQGHSVKLHRH
jgi:phosphatidylglycerol:prolipoprotein diacylglycerol transferase